MGRYVPSRVKVVAGRADAPGDAARDDRTGDVLCREVLGVAGFVPDHDLAVWFNQDAGRTVSFESVRTRGAEWLAEWLTEERQ